MRGIAFGIAALVIAAFGSLAAARWGGLASPDGYAEAMETALPDFDRQPALAASANREAISSTALR